MELNEKIGRALCCLNEKKPLVHQITNYVTANDCANITLAIGALPVMADSIDEVDEMVALADALVINLGTLKQGNLEAMLKAGKKANELGIPIILDPVGVGATSFRKDAATLIMNQLKLSIIRGNLSEIKTLNGVEAITSGVESKEVLSLLPDRFKEGKQIAKVLAQKLGTVVAITGEVDIVTDGKSCYSIYNGCSAMSKVTGTGCMCSALIGAYAGAVTGAKERENENKNNNKNKNMIKRMNTDMIVNVEVNHNDNVTIHACTYADASANVCEISDDLIAAISGVVSIGIAGEAAYEKIKIHNEGIGSFRVRLMDEIYFLTREKIMKNAKIDHN